MLKKFRATQDLTLKLKEKKGEQRGGNSIEIKKDQIIFHNGELIPIDEEGVVLPAMPIGVFNKAVRDGRLEEV